MTVLPLRIAAAVIQVVWSKGKRHLSMQSQLDVARVTIAVLTTGVLWQNTNSSSIYHWIRGQGNFKLYLLKALFCVADILFRKTGFGNYSVL
jgi:hypothetical protein